MRIARAQRSIDLPIRRNFEPAVSASDLLAVLVVDDQKAVRDGLVSLIAASGMPWRAVYAAASRDEAMVIVRRHAPEVIVLDIDLAGDDGLALLSQLDRHERVLVLTTHDDAMSRQRALWLGATGFARKGEPSNALLLHLAAVAAR